MVNGTMMQYFEWFLLPQCKLWNEISREASNLRDLGITAVWMPPAYKGIGGGYDVGYGAYDLYDLGEFNQKGTIETKYGSKDEYLMAIKMLKKNGVQSYGDIVLNHKMGADEAEEVMAREEEFFNRNIPISGTKVIRAWTKFTFPGRNNKYSSFKWDWNAFDGIDYDDKTKRNSIYKFLTKEWSNRVDKENGNYDYLMGADLDFSNRDVVEELKKWGKWYIDFTNIDGFRLDAVKHISYDFFVEWLEYLRKESGKELFSVGEYWHSNVDVLLEYLKNTKYVMSLFDVPLHFNLYEASHSNGDFDMRNIFKGTLVEQYSTKAVTFVDNHDTQLGSSLQSWVENWFKPIAYSLILLRIEGYPCVFYGDYYGIPSREYFGIGSYLDLLLKARKQLAYGEQHDYFDDKNIIGWTREGIKEYNNSGLAVLLTNKLGGQKRMYVGKQFSGEKFRDLLSNFQEKVVIDKDGFGKFMVRNGSLSVWVLDKVDI